jgi:hypothetical protein
MSDPYYQLSLEVMGFDQVIIPGCEPSSVITSDTLLRFQRCCGSTVPLAKALEAIPGSTVRFQINSGINAGYRKRVLVLPPRDLGCSCEPQPDWHQVLRDLACNLKADEPEDLGPNCEPVDMGYCPDPDAADVPAVLDYPYIDEGGSPYGAVTDFVHTWPYNVTLH